MVENENIETVDTKEEEIKTDTEASTAKKKM